MATTSGIIVKPMYEEIGFQILNGNPIFIGLKPIDKDMMRVTYFQATGSIIRNQILGSDIAYSLLCED